MGRVSTLQERMRARSHPLYAVAMCSCVLILLVFVLIISWIFSFIPINTVPQCYIQSLYVPALDKSSNSPYNTSIYLDLKLADKYLTDSIGICYDDISLTLSYLRPPFNDEDNNDNDNDNDYYCNNVTSCIATSSIPKFCQGGKTVKIKKATFVLKGNQLAIEDNFGLIKNLTSNSTTMEFASRQLLAIKDNNENNTAIFQVNLTTFTRAKMPIFTDKHRYSFKVGAIVEVNNQLGLNNKVVQLSGSSAYDRPRGLLVVFLMMFMVFALV